jgi:hypothetical protein
LSSLTHAWADGWRRTLRASWIVVGLWLLTFLLALPLALTLRGMLADHLGGSLAGETAATSVNFDWWNEFLAQAAGIGQTFVPAILGFAAVVKNISSIADADSLPTVIASAVTAHLVVSVFLLGGVLDRLARDRSTGAHGFFAACGVFFFRFLRLGMLAAAIYWLLFVRLHPLLFDTLFSELTREVTVERTAFAYRVGLYVLFGAVLMTVNLIFDYAKIRMVVEDRRSAIGALNAALRFIARRPGAAAGLYLLNGLVFGVVVALYAIAAPGAAGGWYAVVGLLIGQLYIVLRVIVRVAFAASQISLFQSRLAHAGYAARYTPVWPESAGAEAIRPE